MKNCTVSTTCYAQAGGASCALGKNEIVAQLVIKSMHLLRYLLLLYRISSIIVMTFGSDRTRSLKLSVTCSFQIPFLNSI